MEKMLSAQMISALKHLDQKIDQHFGKKVQLMIGGGGAMLLAYQYPLATSDIDALPKGIEISELDVFVKQVATELGLPPDWLNPYFSTYTHVLPSDYGSRLVSVFQGKQLSCNALSKKDLLIMKCFAHRQKDVGHARALIRQGVDTDFVFAHIEFLKAKKIPNSSEAIQFLEMVIDLEDT